MHRPGCRRPERPTAARRPFTREQEARIKELIRETLVQNPKILDEAAESWENRTPPPREAQLGDFIKSNQEVLFNSATSRAPRGQEPQTNPGAVHRLQLPYCSSSIPR